MRAGGYVSPCCKSWPHRWAKASSNEKSGKEISEQKSREDGHASGVSSEIKAHVLRGRGRDGRETLEVNLWVSKEEFAKTCSQSIPGISQTPSK